LNNMLLIIFGMAIVTYIPRMLPLVLLNSNDKNKFLKRFLKLIPFTALSALIFPGIINSTGNPFSAIVGGSVAIVLAYFNINLVFVIIASISSVVLFNMF